MPTLKLSMTDTKVYNKSYIIGETVQTPRGELKYLADTGRRNPSTGNIIGKWRCTCGNSFETMNRNITSGATQSCGCLSIEINEAKMINPALIYLYSLHASIWSRCYNEKNNSYERYGKIGITFQEDWRDNNDKFVADLLQEIGHRPTKKHQLDRIDNDNNYISGNLRWVTAKENNRNKSNNRRVEINGETKTVAEWAEISGLKYALILGRLNQGWTGEKLLKPARKNVPHDEISKDLWKNIKARCFNPDCGRYERYGGRGITMYEPWINDFERFKADVLANAGPRPKGRVCLDRIDNNGNYEPGNIRWVTIAENNRNLSKNVNITINEETKTLNEWSTISGISCSAIRRRIENNWPEEEWLLPDQRKSVNDETVRLVRDRAAGGQSLNSISDELDIHRRTVIDIVRRRAAYEE